MKTPGITLLSMTLHVLRQSARSAVPLISTGLGLVTAMVVMMKTGPAYGQEPTVGEVVYVGSTQAPGEGDLEQPLFNMEVESAPLARIQVEYTPDFVEDWQPWTPPVTALYERTPISIPVADLPGRGFFRIVVLPPRVSVKREAGEIVVEVTDTEAEADEVRVGLQRLLGDLPFLSLPHDPEATETSPEGKAPPLARGVYRGVDLAHLGRRLNWRLWDAAPAEDDIAIADRFVPLDTDRGRPTEVPGDGGEGVIEDGWQGDNVRTPPERIDVLPEPGAFDMKYVPGLEPVLTEQEGGSDVDPGHHVRLRVRFDGQTFTFERAVAQSTGSGLLPAPFVAPSEGSFVLAVRQANGQIYHLLPFADPRLGRSYEPPTGGSHGNRIAADGSVRLTVPIIGDDVLKGLDGLDVSILRVSGPLAGDGGTLLTPALVNRNPNLFPVVQRLSGGEIVELLRASEGRPRPRPRAATRAATMTPLHRSGSNASKFNVAVMGDGFRDVTADQDAFNNYVRDNVMNTLETRDIHPAVLNGMNIFRINTYSVDSGVTLVNSTGAVTTTRSTALEYRFSGLWNRCWMEAGPNSQALIDDVIDDVCPQADFVVLVLNTTSFGGCAGGNRFTVTRGAGWDVVAHEFGHRPGTLGDEYTCGSGSCGCYGNAEPGAPNLTANTTRATLKWNAWVPSWRPLPTTAAHIADNSQDVGLFAGATIGSGQWTSCIFRPSRLGRMNNNSPPHNPVGYTNVREQFLPYQSADLRRYVAGDFNGDGRGDIVAMDGRQFALFLSANRNVGPNDPVSGNPPRNVTGVLTPTWFRTDFMYNAAGNAFWRGRPDDILLPGDFDGDGRDDLYVINHTSWNKPYVVFMKSFGDRFEIVGGYAGDLPGWERRPGDVFYVADFNNDGRDDLLVYNGTNWSIPYFGMLRSTGAALQMARRYDKFLPGWEMGRHEQFHVGDFNGDGRQDVIAFNRQSWAQVHLQVHLSTGAGLSLADRHYGTIPGIWQMRRRDQLHVLDFTGDKSSDIAIFNGLDWGPTYLAYIASNEGKLSGRRRYDNSTAHLPGWQLQRRDRFHVANIDGDADQDLVVYNKDNWSTQYLGILKSNMSPTAGFSASGSWQADWINGWNLGANDVFQVVDFRGGAGWDDLLVANQGWFGMLRGYHTHFRLETIYRKWIFNHRYHSAGWW